MKIILAPIDYWDRKELELIENTIVDSINWLTERDCLILEPSDFMDMCNNQEVDLEKFWLSYILN